MAKDLSLKQRKAVVALAGGADVEQAAEQSGAGVRTVYRWLQEPLFSRELAHAQEQSIRYASGKLVALLSDAVSVLEELMSTGSAQQRRLAATTIIDNCIRLRELSVLEQRVRVLEEQRDGK